MLSTRQNRAATTEYVSSNTCTQPRFRSACAFCIAKDATFLHADNNEDPYQTARIRRLI